MLKKILRKQNGFTLLELLISTALTVVIMLTITALFTTFLLSNSKVSAKKNMKDAGVRAMSQIEFLIKNSYHLDEELTPCNGTMTSLALTSIDGTTTVLEEVNGQIASNSATLTPSSFTLSDLNFSCTGEKGYRKITISFTLEKVTPDGDISEEFMSTVTMRN